MNAEFPKKFISSTLQARFIASALFTAVIAGTWDAWWHSAFGRESFYSPPHILLYISVLLAIFLGIYGWHQTKEKMWKRLATILILIPLSAPFDELWYRVFGAETLASPLIVWSPPHVILVLSIIASFFLILPILKKDENKEAQRLFGVLCFAGIFALLLFLVSPLEPFAPYHLLGFWGAGFSTAIFAGILLAVKKWIPGTGTAFLFVGVVCILLSIGPGEKIAPNIVIPPHDHPPDWLEMFSLILPALIVDLFYAEHVRGLLAD